MLYRLRREELFSHEKIPDAAEAIKAASAHNFPRVVKGARTEV
jgi:hypothetical protein